MDLIHCVSCVIIAMGVVQFTDAFNIDLKTAVVFRGKLQTGFGYTAEFIRSKAPATGTRLLVSAPNETVTDRQHSGIHYLCDPNFLSTSSSTSPCVERTSLPRAAMITDNGRFGEDSELFGLALAMADQDTAVMCGPMWSDLEYWRFKYIFNIGRCHILTTDGDTTGEGGVVPYHNTSNYMFNVELEGRISRQMYYGNAEFGFSADGDGAGRVVIGSPGFSVSRGGVVVLDARLGNFSIMHTILDPDADSVLGYEVAVGNFCGPKRFCFAAGNRHVFGKVHLLEHVSGEMFKPLWWKQADQEYSSFGSVLCAVDVTGDGWADLLVGAPTHSVYGNDTRSYDQGRVFLYISLGEVNSGQSNFVDGTTLTGDQVKSARFGSAIADIGDINRDSINDVAVGAPLAEDGSGAVYIYLGNPVGLADRYSQKITGQDFSPPLTSFGTHITTATHSLSSYGYPDFAVGAPQSDVVVFLRTRLIVNANVTLSATPNPVDPANGKCPQQPSFSQTACITVTLCLAFQYSMRGPLSLRDSSFTFRSLDFDVALEVDQLIATDNARRVRVLSRTDDTTSTSLRETFTVSYTSDLCHNYTAILRQDQINRNPFVPVQLQAAFKLNTTTFPDIAPMLNQSMPNTATEQVKFKNKCGDDGQCRTDLVMTGRILHMPEVYSIYPFNVINQTKELELELDLVNTGETSFGVKVTVNVSDHVEFWTATGNSSLVCDRRYNQEESTLMECTGYTPLGQNEAIRIRLQFKADSVRLVSSNQVVTFQVTAMPFDPVENPEVNMDNNEKVLKSRTAIVADVRLDGSSTPGTISVEDADRRDMTLTHRLLLTNRGPSFMPPTHLNVSLPVVDETGNELLHSANVTMKLADGMLVECPQILDTGGVVWASTTIATTTAAATTATTPEGGGGGGGSGTAEGTTTGDPFGGGGILPSKKRRRREAGNDVDEKDNERQMIIDCSGYGCRTYQCPLVSKAARQLTEINVTVVVRRSAIVFPGNIDTILYRTSTSVAQPDHALFYPWAQPRNQQVQTTFKRLTSADEISIWIIIVGVGAGLLLLIIIAILAWKLGFFRRADKAKLERLKRQSGFYEGRASTRRRGEQPSTPGGEATAE